FGAAMAVAVPVALWAYFTGATYFALTLMNQDVEVPRLSRVFGVSMMIATLGKMVSCILFVAELTSVGRWIYAGFSIAGLGVAAYAIHRDERVPREEAGLAVALPFLLLEGLFYLVTSR
ncbi:MAG: hypothetical protein ABJE47_25310, partial [bacterium]